MKKYYAIVLFIFAFQLMTTAINSEDIFSIQMDEVGGATIAEINASTYEQMEVSTDIADDSLISSIFTGAGLLIDALKLLVIVVAKTLVIYPTLTAYGMPASFAVVFQGMNTLIQGLAIVEFKTGRRTA